VLSDFVGAFTTGAFSRTTLAQPIADDCAPVRHDAVPRP